MHGETVKNSEIVVVAVGYGDYDTKRNNWIKIVPSSIILDIIQGMNTANFNTTFILCLVITQRNARQFNLIKSRLKLSFK